MHEHRNLLSQKWPQVGGQKPFSKTCWKAGEKTEKRQDSVHVNEEKEGCSGSVSAAGQSSCNKVGWQNVTPTVKKKEQRPSTKEGTTDGPKIASWLINSRKKGPSCLLCPP